MKLSARGLFLLTVFLVACRPAAPVSRRATRGVAWVSPDSLPQLQAYRWSWPAGVEPAPQCRAQGVVIDADSIGPLRIGERLPGVLATCPHVLVGYDWGDEAIPEPALMVRFGLAAVLITLTDTTDTATVYYLSTSDTTLRTLDGIHVGEAIKQVADAIGPLEFEEGECGLFASSRRRPNLGLHLSLPGDSLECGNLVPKPPALPRGSEVVEIFLHGAA